MCCGVLQHIVVCCSVFLILKSTGWWICLYNTSLDKLQCVAVCCSVLQCVAVCCSVRQCAAVSCREFHSCDVTQWLIDVTYAWVTMSHWICSVLQCVAMCCSALQCIAVCGSELQRVSLVWRDSMTHWCDIWMSNDKSLSHVTRVKCISNRVGSRFTCLFWVLQCVAVCRSALQYVTVCCSVLQCAADVLLIPK